MQYTKGTTYSQIEQQNTTSRDNIKDPY